MPLLDYYEGISRAFSGDELAFAGVSRSIELD
jgi:hypothetical protein